MEREAGTNRSTGGRKVRNTSAPSSRLLGSLIPTPAPRPSRDLILVAANNGQKVDIYTPEYIFVFVRFYRFFYSYI